MFALRGRAGTRPNRSWLGTSWRIVDLAENSYDNNGQLVPRRGAVLGIAVAASVVVHLPLYLSLIFGGGCIAGALVTCGLTATVPFVLARVAPRAANFDTQWFPRAWSHWLWFLGMVFLLFVCRMIAAMLADPLGLRYYPTLVIPTAATVILTGIVVILIGPIAEEIFWRGYLLEQLRKLTRPAAALLIQSLLFGLVHIHQSQGYVALIQAFLMGAVLGMWRIRFRSFLPLMLAHMIINGVAVIPTLTRHYETAKLAEPVADNLAEYVKNVRANPKCRQIEALAMKPAQEAVPALIDFFADPDKDVSTYAQTVLIERFRGDAEPYLKATLSSRDKNTVSGALFVVGQCRYSVYKPEVRDIARSADDVVTQISAVMTLLDLDDEGGLRGIARNHPNAKVRESAEKLLGWLLERTSADSSPPVEGAEPSTKSAPGSR